MFIDLFIHLFIDMSIPLYVHSFTFFHNQIPLLIAYIVRRQAEIDLIVTLSAKFQMNWRIDQMRRLTPWLFIILAPNKGGSVEEITLYQRFQLLYIEKKQVEIDQIVALSTEFPINLNMD